MDAARHFRHWAAMESDYALLFLSNFRLAPLPLEVDGPAPVKALAMTTVPDVVEVDAHEGPSTLARGPSFGGVSVPQTPSKPAVVANDATLDSALSASLAEVDSRMASNLDKFFNDDKNWSQVVCEVASSSGLRSPTAHFEYDGASVGHARFKVCVPKAYPGVQYRMSKNLEHRYPRYARQGAIVTGLVEDGGDWLRVNDHVFLPLKAAGDNMKVDRESASLPLGRPLLTSSGGGAYAEGARPALLSRSVSENGAALMKSARRSQAHPPDHVAGIFMKATRNDVPSAVEAGRSPALAEPRQPGDGLETVLSGEGIARIVGGSINPFSDTPPGSRVESPRI